MVGCLITACIIASYSLGFVLADGLDSDVIRT
jgi:hypothetical protein